MRLCIVLAVAVAAAGCAAAPMPLYNPKASNAGSAALARNVIDRQAVSLHEGMQGVIVFSVGRLTDMSYKGCALFLTQKGVIPGQWGIMYSEKTPLTRGMLAYMLVRALGIRGGLTMQVFGPSERYALRECQKMELIERGSANSQVSGREFLSIMRKAGEYAKNKLGKG
jgi:hypothetical protein